MSENRSISGLNDAEAQEFHAFYVQGLVGFVAIAVIAHLGMGMASLVFVIFS